ncbi:MAG: CopG/DNA-binding domain-containing protein [Candidatus Aramenus sulfurataquae]|jgi:predicted RNase H-like nuclease (RuvC/YqgF family)|uniref:CopG family transcriptional regulator n=2 Tax=Candidatus Aramenus sulfurataquae TaxID=1326980 RepID=W7KJ45_9CREN|nr:MAG: CopG/DNA-binding domain-containing protein [Candidatus Aramenus sulfurataquae]MCL7343259.1 CopG family transcriptional regulator [Candidatus Aramenus sulfurataquae]
MKTIIIKLTDEEYAKLEEEARKEGYVLLTEYVRSKLLSSFTLAPSSPSRVESVNYEEMLRKIERKIQDMINPFTSQIEDLKQRLADLQEKVDSLEEKSPKPRELQPKEKLQRQPTAQEKKTALDILSEQGVIFESELKLKDPDRFFEKLEREGAKILLTDKERIAVDPNFYNSFVEKLSKLSAQDDETAKQQLGKKEFKLFQRLKEAAYIYFDSSSKSWKFVK